MVVLVTQCVQFTLLKLVASNTAYVRMSSITAAVLRKVAVGPKNDLK